MDLYAYANIEELDVIAKKNGIDVPRLRGYRLMKEEKPVDIKELIKNEKIDYYSVKELCESDPFWCPTSDTAILSGNTDIKIRYYTNQEVQAVRWDKIHGWKRKVLKTFIHNETVRYRKQYEVWNRYAGRDDVLYIHARIGGNNWPYYWKQVVYQPWFLEKVDDAFDSTYCDIYALLSSQ